MKYYQDKYNMNSYEMQAFVEAYIKEYSYELPRLTQLVMDEQNRKIDKLHQTQSTLLNNHLFLYDVLDNSEESVQDKLLTKYTKIPEDLVFKDQKIIELLKEK